MSVLRTEGIVKDYPGTRALDDVTVSFEGGKVHAFIGKNGSGKSTLVKVFSGAIQPTQGKFFLDDQELRFSDPTDAFKQGIATVYQELSLVPYLTVAENIYLGRLPKKGKVIDWKKTYEMAGELLKKMNVDIDPHEKVFRLSMWQCQVVEITKAMSFSPKVLMLDEPTSALAQNETQSLFEVVRTLRDQGVVVIYISHRLQEIWEIADTVTVLRDGKFIGKKDVGELDHKGVIKMMFGDVELKTRPTDLVVSDEVVMKVEGLTRAGKFSDVSFELKKGEVLGIAGMLGAGRTELLRSLFGVDGYDSGTITMNGAVMVRRATPEQMKKRGMGLTPEERKNQGVILIHSIRDNLCNACLDKVSDHHIINRRRREEFASRQVEDLEIKIPNIMASVGALSGGNQQKVVIGNWLNTDPKIMMYDEPSRGIDVNAKQQIFQIMWDQSRKGVSSIFVSSELEELLDHMIELLLVVMIIALSIAEPKFISIGNILNVLRNCAMKGVIAYGMCLVIISGEIDLSVGSQVALSAVIAAWVSKALSAAGVMSQTMDAVVGVLAAIAVAMLIGTFHAWARHKFGMPSFIVTLANLNILYGLAAIICGGFPITDCFPDWYVKLGTGRILGIPVPALIFILVFFLFWFLMEKTELGRQIYAVGGNAEAARLNGISVWRTRLFVMCIVQLMCVLSGVMNSTQVRSATFGFGRGWETQIISSVVIGGTSMLGGIGTVWGTLIGVLFTGVINNGMTLLNVNEYMQYVVNGGLMFFAVWFNTYVTRQKS